MTTNKITISGKVYELISTFNLPDGYGTVRYIVSDKRGNWLNFLLSEGEFTREQTKARANRNPYSRINMRK